MPYTVDKLLNGNVVIKNDGVNIDFSLPPTAKLSISNDGKDTVNAIFDKQPLWGFNLQDIDALQIEGVPETLPTTPAELMNALSTLFFFRLGAGGAGPGGANVHPDPWDNTVTYNQGQLVIGSDGKDYSSEIDNNLDNDPTILAGDLSNASFTGKSFNISAQDAIPRDIHLSPNGTKMYVLGNTNTSIYEYNLSTPGDPESAIFTGNSFDVSNEDAAPRDLYLSPDGLTMFMLGTNTSTVYQYALTIPSSLAAGNVVFTGNIFDLSNEDSLPNSLHFLPGGLDMYMVGALTDAVYQYALTIPFSLAVSNVTFTGNSLSIAAQDAAPVGLHVIDDGFKFYMLGNTSDSVYEYNFGIAKDLSTAVFSGNSFSIATEDLTSQGVHFSSDGLDMYMAGNTSNSIFLYDVPATWALLLTDENTNTGLIFLQRGTVQTDPVVGFTPLVEQELSFDLATVNSRGDTFSFLTDRMQINRNIDANMDILLSFSSGENVTAIGNIELRRVSDNVILASADIGFLPRKSASIRAPSQAIIQAGISFIQAEAQLFVTFDEADINLEAGQVMFTANEFII